MVLTETTWAVRQFGSRELPPTLQQSPVSFSRMSWLSRPTALPHAVMFLELEQGGPALDHGSIVVLVVWISATPWTVACQAPLCVGFPRQGYWNGLPFPSSGDLPNPEIKPISPASEGGFFFAEPPGKPPQLHYFSELLRKPCLCLAWVWPPPTPLCLNISSIWIQTHNKITLHMVPVWRNLWHFENKLFNGWKDEHIQSRQLGMILTVFLSS